MNVGNNSEYQKSYGGNICYKPRKPDFTKCAKEVSDRSGWYFAQCSRPRGHGPSKSYCKQHAKKFEGMK